MPRATYTEDLTALVDGTRVDFPVTAGPFIPGTLNVDHNGVRLRPGFDFQEAPTSDGFTLVFAPKLGDVVLAQFEVDDAGAGFPLVVASGIDPTIW